MANCPKCGAEESLTPYHWKCGSWLFAEDDFVRNHMCEISELNQKVKKLQTENVRLKDLVEYYERYIGQGIRRNYE